MLVLYSSGVVRGVQEGGGDKPTNRKNYVVKKSLWMFPYHSNCSQHFLRVSLD